MLALGLLGILGFGHAAWAAEQADEHVPFHSWTALRIVKDVVLQRLDFSCGAASIATLATYFLGKPTTEEAALLIIRARISVRRMEEEKTRWPLDGGLGLHSEKAWV